MAQRMYPLRIAVATRWARSPLPSLRAMRARWDLMVSAESPSCSPTCRFDFPSATIRRTWSSRSLRGPPGMYMDRRSRVGSGVGAHHDSPHSADQRRARPGVGLELRTATCAIRGCAACGSMAEQGRPAAGSRSRTCPVVRDGRRNRESRLRSTRPAIVRPGLAGGLHVGPTGGVRADHEAGDGAGCCRSGRCGQHDDGSGHDVLLQARNQNIVHRHDCLE